MFSKDIPLGLYALMCRKKAADEDAGDGAGPKDAESLELSRPTITQNTMFRVSSPMRAGQSKTPPEPGRDTLKINLINQSPESGLSHLGETITAAADPRAPSVYDLDMRESTFNS